MPLRTLVAVPVVAALALSCAADGQAARTETLAHEGFAPRPPQPEPEPPVAASDADLRRHPDDRIVTGRIAQVSPESVSIRSDEGLTRLELAAETVVIAGGKYARTWDLREGQEVRASYAAVGARDVAQKIAVDRAAAGSDATDQGGSGMGPPGR